MTNFNYNTFDPPNPINTPKLLKQKVEIDEIGIKTKKGFYEWTDESIAALKYKIAKSLVEIQNWDN